MDISIAICTYKRPTLLKNAMDSLLAQNTDLSYEIIIVDNDINQTADSVYTDFKTNSKNIPVYYFSEPVQNIALARNKTVKESTGDYVAFIDDDECASENWLEHLYTTLKKHNYDAIFGPVVTEYPSDFPKWIKGSGLFDRERHNTGDIYLGHGRTGNALVRRDLLITREGPFKLEFGLIGGEDDDFFTWFRNRGYIIGWCDEAPVYEKIGNDRAKLSWNLVRGYRGGWGHSSKIVKQHGLLKGIFYILLSVFTGSLKSLYEALKKGHKPGTALFVLITRVSGQVGKVGYLFGIKIEEYKQ